MAGAILSHMDTKGHVRLQELTCLGLHLLGEVFRACQWGSRYSALLHRSLVPSVPMGLSLPCNNPEPTLLQTDAPINQEREFINLALSTVSSKLLNKLEDQP